MTINSQYSHVVGLWKIWPREQKAGLLTPEELSERRTGGVVALTVIGGALAPACMAKTRAALRPLTNRPDLRSSDGLTNLSLHPFYSSL